jgi:hypothetical protein
MYTTAAGLSIKTLIVRYAGVMKAFLFLILPSILSAQIFSFGAKGGLPLTPTYDSQFESSRFFEGTAVFEMKRYAFGPTVEAKLPLGFRVEVDGLYQHVRTTAASAGAFPTGALTFMATTATAWEIPMLLKRRFGHRTFAPYAAVGSTLRHIGDVNETEWILPSFPGYSPSFTHAVYPSGEPLRAGITAAAGVSIKTHGLRFEPELRYTHWTSDHYLATTEQLDFLVGITFSPRAR